MIFRDRAYQRGVELGSYPLESLPRGAPNPDTMHATLPRPCSADCPQGQSLVEAAKKYEALFLSSIEEQSCPVAIARAPVPDDLPRRTQEIKGAAYYLDASHVGICEAPANAETSTPRFAITLMVEYGRAIEDDSLAHSWLQASQHAIANMRAVEIGACITGHLRALGYSAQLHCKSEKSINIAALCIQGGIAQLRQGVAESPFFKDQFAAVAITTDYALTCDEPLADQATYSKLRYWLGINGAVSGRERNRAKKRPSHFSRYPMEQVPTVERPTTLIFDDEVPRVPKRAEFFMRARSGDLGEKAQREVARFALKHPLTDGMIKPLRAMVPHQDGGTAAEFGFDIHNAEANTKAIRSLSYHLGADLTGICEIPRYAWYSHGPDGQPIEMEHKYAVVMLIDQGYDTMEGASGDDWISGCQSMRGYLRGAEIAGMMADFLRSQGVSARPQTNADSQVLHIPLVLWAGLGELSRIGELALNPFVGPRFKSVVLTTNLPLIPDKPVDFGLQAFCGSCMKCARECPVSAIPFGDKVMFNGYEIWKPDVERCTRYRVTNPKGSACGRCMKTCPLNKVVDSDGALAHRVGTWLGLHAKPLKPLLVPLAVWLDDKLQYGKRNHIKRWWLDLEMVNGVAVQPKATNERDLDVNADTTGARSPVGYYHANNNPPPDSQEPVPVNHKAAVVRATQLESIAEARARRAACEAKPSHYIPTPPANREPCLDSEDSR